MSHPLASRTSFDAVATLYDSIRPGYPEAIYEDLAELSGVEPGGSVLEIGCGTGQASVALAKRGYRLDCIELGPALASVARSRLAGYGQAHVRVGAFEELETEMRYDLVVSAQAFHWIAADRRCGKAAELLNDGGSLAVWWNRHVRIPRDLGFFDAVQELYRAHVPELVPELAGSRLSEQVAGTEEEIQSSGFFERVQTRTHPWEESYDSAGYERLLGTYSDHLALSPEQRDLLLQGIEELIDTRFGGRITKGYVTVLHVAKKKPSG
jgi:SAM-dependent methyltransferase